MIPSLEGLEPCATRAPSLTSANAVSRLTIVFTEANTENTAIHNLRRSDWKHLQDCFLHSAKLMRTRMGMAISYPA